LEKIGDVPQLESNVDGSKDWNREENNGERCKGDGAHLEWNEVGEKVGKR